MSKNTFSAHNQKLYPKKVLTTSSSVIGLIQPLSGWKFLKNFFYSLYYNSRRAKAPQLVGKKFSSGPAATNSRRHTSYAKKVPGFPCSHASLRRFQIFLTTIMTALQNQKNAFIINRLLQYKSINFYIKRS